VAGIGGKGDAAGPSGAVASGISEEVALKAGVRDGDGPEAPEPSRMDLAVHAVVAEALARYGDVADVEHAWGAPAGMWFTEVTPRREGAAALSLAFDGEDLLSITVGNTWFEWFPFEERSLVRLREFVNAVVAGHVEEAGTSGNAFARIATVSGTMSVGAAHLPMPWRWRPRRHYWPYSPPPPA
jgi:hypothetical protein